MDGHADSRFNLFAACVDAFYRLYICFGVDFYIYMVPEISGFGEISMADRTYQLFKNNISKTASINGATQIRAGVMRPEIFVGSEDDSIINDSFDQDKLAISIGSKVRIIREPFFGCIGEVIELPKELVTIDTETTSRVAKIKLNDNSCEIIPRANLEVILLD